MKNNSCIILANGQFPQSEQALRTLREAEYICCCDGAVNKLVAAGLLPNVIVGDGDTISAELKERFAKIFIKIDEQEYNDLTKATIHCCNQGFDEITYLGATGLREDHTIANVFLLPFYLEQFNITPTMLTDEGLFSVFKGNSVIKTNPKQQISIFNINCTRLSACGLKWQISPFKQLWQGTLNEALGEGITIEADGVYIVFQKNGIKD